MPEATPTPWMFDAAVFVGVFSALTWGFLVLFKPRLYQGGGALPEPRDED
ncbi:MAG: hypothetical protein AAGA48_06325 [Myxococcota bacterium]